MEEDLFDAKTRAKILGENLERIRKARGYSRKQLADAVGITENSFGTYERGTKLAPLDKIFKLAKFLDVSVVDLTGDNPNVEDKIIFKYRFQKAMDTARIAFMGERPKIDDNGRITVSPLILDQRYGLSPAHIVGYNAITFENAEEFVRVMEQAETYAVLKSFNEAFCKIVYKQQE